MKGKIRKIKCEYCKKFVNPKDNVCCYGKTFCSMVCLREYEKREEEGK